VSTGAPSTSEVIISADSHVTEPEDLWATRLPIQLRDQAPEFKRRERKRDARWADKGLGGVLGGRDPLARVREMEEDGVSAEVLYPTLALRLFSLSDPKLQEACFKVYNDWITDYCAVSPERLVGLGCISVYDIKQALAEMERCKAAGLRGIMIWQTPDRALPFQSAHYEPLWSAAEDMDLPLNLHILTGHNYQLDPAFAPDKGVEFTRGSVNMKLFDAVNALFDFVFYGILQRHPRLKLVIVENEIGWIPFLLQQWDYYYSRHGGAEGAPIDRAPSYYFARQVYATFFDDAVGGHNFSRWGATNYMWSNDFPHPNSTWPESRQVIERDLGHLPAAERAKLVRDNVVRLYNLTLPATT
jgi:uncharacterized protein